MAIFNSYVSLPEGITTHLEPCLKITTEAMVFRLSRLEKSLMQALDYVRNARHGFFATAGNGGWVPDEAMDAIGRGLFMGFP